MNNNEMMLLGKQHSYYRISQSTYEKEYKSEYSLWMDDAGNPLVAKVVSDTCEARIIRAGILSGLDNEPMRINPVIFTDNLPKFRFIDAGNKIIVWPELKAAGEFDRFKEAFREKLGINQKGCREYQKRFQTHHIIPENKAGIVDHEVLAKAGFNVDSRSNFIVLPKNTNSTPDSDNPTNRSFHRGGHSTYNDALIEQLNEIEKYGRSQNWDSSQYHAALSELISDIRYGLRQGMIAMHAKEDVREGAEPLSEKLLETIREEKNNRVGNNPNGPGGGGNGSGSDPGGNGNGNNDPRGSAQNLADQARNSNFQEVIQTTHLESTYNSTNPGDPICPRGASSSEIGGVGLTSGQIEGMKNTLSHLFERQHLFLIPNTGDGLPLSQGALQQIIRELAVGIFYHDKKPMFSLHFNQDGTLFPVIGPEYEHTLVGHVMGLLDYIMKGYLNGGIFDQDFISEWNKRPNKETQGDIARLIDLKLYCAQHLDSGETYKSLRELMDLAGLANSDSDDAKIRSSFRIIADNPIVKTDDAFLIGTDFRVEYTIEGTPEFQAYLQRYEKLHGQPPKAYKKLVEIYEVMTHEIKHKMPQMPMCRELFNMLGVIHFFSYYFSTLKTMGEVPLLKPVPYYKQIDFPALLPPLPIRQHQTKLVDISFTDIAKQLSEQAKDTLNEHVMQLQQQAQKQPLEDAAAGKEQEATNDPTSDDRQTAHLITVQKQLADVVLAYRDSQVKGELVTELSRFSAKQIKQFANRWLKALADALKQFQQTITAEKATLTDTIKTIKETANTKKQAVSEQFRARDVELQQEVRTQIRSMLHARGIYDEQQIDFQVRGNIRNIRTKLNAEFGRIMKEMNATVKKMEADIHRMQQEIEQLEVESKHPLSCQRLTDGIIFQLPATTTDLYPPSTNINDNFANFRIVGGCGVYVPQQAIQSMSAGKALVEAAWQSLESRDPEVLSKTQFQGQSYSVFRLGLQSSQAIHDTDFAWMKGLLYRAPKSRLSSAQHQEIKTTFWQLADLIFTESLQSLQGVLAKLSTKDQILTEIFRLKDEQGQSLVHFAAAIRDTHFTELLLHYGAKVATKDDIGYTPFHTAAMKGNIEIAGLLLQHKKAFLNNRAKNHANALYVAVQHNQLSMVRWLLSVDANPNQAVTSGMTPLYIAIHREWDDISALLLQQPNLFPNPVLPDGTSPLYLSAEQGKLSLVKQLLDHGAEPALSRIDGLSPLHAACEQGHAEVVNAILVSMPGSLSRQFHINKVLPSGMTALHYAVQSDSLAVVTVLYDHEADLSIRNQDSETALMMAIHLGYKVIAAFLIKRMSSQHLNIRDQLKNTAFMLAVQYGFYPLANLIFQHGGSTKLSNLFTTVGTLFSRGPFSGDKDLKSEQQLSGMNLAHYVARNGDRLELRGWAQAGLIKEHHFSETDHNGRTPEVLALEKGRGSLVTWFRGYWADSILKDPTNVVSPYGLQVVHFAAQHGLMDILKSYLTFSDPEVRTNHYVKNRVVDSRTADSHITDNHAASEKSAPKIVTPKQALAAQYQRKYHGKTLAMLAAENGQLGALRLILKYDQEYTQEERQQLMVFAIKGGSMECLQLFNTDYSEPLDSAGNTALHHMAQQGNLMMLKAVLALGFDINVENQRGESPLYTVCEYQQSILFDYLLHEHKQVMVTEALLQFAIQYTDLAQYKQLLSRNTTIQWGAPGAGTKLLKAAIDSDKADKLTLLLSKGADASAVQASHADSNDTDSNDTDEAYSLLMMAAKKGNYAMVSSLVGHLSHPVQVVAGNTALHIASEHGYWDCVLALLAAGYDATTQNQQGKTAIEVAHNRQWAEIIFAEGGEYYHAQAQKLVSALHNDNESLINSMIELIHYDGRLNLRGESLPLIHILIEMDFSIDFSALTPDDYQVKNSQGITALLALAQKGNVAGLQDAAEKLSIEQLNHIDQLGLLHAAAIGGHAAAVKLLLKLGVEVEQLTNDDGWTSLHFAAHNGNREVLRVLFQHGADINAECRQRRTPLLMAISESHIAAAKLLIEAGATTKEIPGYQTVTLLEAACITENQEALRLLLANGVDPNIANRRGIYPIQMAAQKGLLHFVKRLSFVSFHQVLQQNRWGISAIHLAAQYASPKVLAALLPRIQRLRDKDVDQPVVPIVKSHLDHDLGDQFDLKITPGTTLLHTAIVNGRLANTELLIDNGAALTAKNNQDMGVMGFLGASGSEDIFKLLSEYQLFDDKEGRDDAFMQAIIHDHLNIIELLASDGYSVDTYLNDGSNGLLLSGRLGRQHITQWLIQQGVSASYGNMIGQKPIHGAVAGGHIPTTKTLLQTGFNIDERNSRGETLLHIAVQHRQSAMAAFLIVHGINACARNDNRETALAVALRGKDFLLVQIAYVAMVATIATRVAMDMTEDTDNKNTAKDTAKDLLNRLIAGPYKSSIESISENLRASWQDLNRAGQQSIAAGDSPLHLAVRLKVPELTQMLLARGDAADAVNHQGDTPLHLAQDIAVARYLMQAGANVDQQNHQGETAVLTHLKSQHFSMAQFLLQSGADVTHVDHADNTCLSVLWEQGNQALFQQFRERVVKQNTPIELEEEIQQLDCSAEDKQYLMTVLAKEPTARRQESATSITAETVSAVASMDEKRLFSLYSNNQVVEPGGLDLSKNVVQDYVIALLEQTPLVTVMEEWLQMDLTCIDAQGNSPLHWTAEQLDVHRFSLLNLSGYFDANQPNKKGYIPGVLALRDGFTERSRQILAHACYFESNDNDWAIFDDSSYDSNIESNKDSNKDSSTRLYFDIEQQFRSIIEHEDPLLLSGFLNFLQAYGALLEMDAKNCVTLFDSDKKNLLLMYIRKLATYNNKEVADDYQCASKKILSIITRLVEHKKLEALAGIVAMSGIINRDYKGLSLLNTLLSDRKVLLTAAVIDLFAGHYSADLDTVKGAETVMYHALKRGDLTLFKRIYYHIAREIGPMGDSDFTKLINAAKTRSIQNVLRYLARGNAFSVKRDFGYDWYLSILSNDKVKPYRSLLLGVSGNVWSTQFGRYLDTSARLKGKNATTPIEYILLQQSVSMDFLVFSMQQLCAIKSNDRAYQPAQQSFSRIMSRHDDRALSIHLDIHKLALNDTLSPADTRIAVKHILDHSRMLFQNNRLLKQGLGQDNFMRAAFVHKDPVIRKLAEQYLSFYEQTIPKLMNRSVGSLLQKAEFLVSAMSELLSQGSDFKIEYSAGGDRESLSKAVSAKVLCAYLIDQYYQEKITDKTSTANLVSRASDKRNKIVVWAKKSVHAQKIMAVIDQSRFGVAK